MDNNNVLLCASRILFGQNRKPNVNKYIIWTDNVHLKDLFCYLRGPFGSTSHPDIIKLKEYIVLGRRKFCLTSCNFLGILFPIIIALTNYNVVSCD